MDVLTDHGVAPIASDGPFDPMRHEAVTSEPSESVPSGHIIATLRAGYEYKGRVLRPALVRVAM
jgi:molecular chaperone GrpE